MLAAQMVGLEDDQNPVFKSSLLPMCVSLFSVSRNCTLKIEYLSGETVKDVEKIKGRFVGVLPNSCILGYSCLSVFYFTTLKSVDFFVYIVYNYLYEQATRVRASRS